MKNRIFSLILMCVVFLGLFPKTVSAETIIDFSEKGSITVTAIYNGDPLKDLKLNCIRVGDLISSGDSYYFECIYDDSIIFTGVNIHNSNNPEKMLELVHKNNGIAVSVKADQEGNIVFNNLLPGLYLIYQDSPQTLNGYKYELSAFLVTIPYDGKMHVDADSKLSLDLYPEETTPDSTTPTQKKPVKLPQTGQLNWPIPALASGGMLLFALGWWLVFGSRKDTYDA